MVTIKQVAVHAGVSFKTVSRVVNNDPTVKDVNRQKVLNSIKVLGYLPNRAASQTRKKKSGIIGFIADELLSVPYTFDMIRGAQDIAWKKNMELMVLNVNEKRYSLTNAIQNLLEHRVEGVIYSAMYHREVHIPEGLRQVPTVLANCFAAGKGYPCVVPDEIAAAETIIEALFNRGFKRIAFLNLNDKIVAAKGRKQGVLNAFNKHHRSLDNLHIESVIVDTEQGEQSFTREAAVRIINDFKPDAILCGQDPMAMEVYFIVAALGLKVGEDIGIASFDDWDVIPTLLQPTLTTMALPHYDMGVWAMEYLLAQRNDIVHQLLPFKISVRQSF